jgi:hypothetical protein
MSRAFPPILTCSRRKTSPCPGECDRAVLGESSTPTEALACVAVMDLPGWYLVAGCLYQTVWNAVTAGPLKRASWTMVLCSSVILANRRRGR